MKLKTLCGVLGAAVIATCAASAVTGCMTAGAENVATSPNGKISLSFGVDSGRVFYTVRHHDRTVIDTSYLAIDARQFSIGRNSELRGTHRDSHDETWETVWGEESTIRNHYNEISADFAELDSAGVSFSIVFRVFDDGVGFRYVIPRQEAVAQITVTDEATEFNLHEDAVAWSIPWNHEYYEHVWEPRLVSKLDTVSSPLTIKVTDSLYLAIHEAALTDYAKMNLMPDAEGSTRLKSYLTPWSNGDKVRAQGEMSTPWRTVIVAECPGDLMLSRLMLNLNEPCAWADDTAWIEPGRYIGIWWGMHMKDYTWEQGPNHGATTENTKRYIDFAAANGFQGVLVEGWNEGWDGDWSANGDKFSFTKAYPDYDLEELAAYAREKGVKLIAHHETGGAATNYENQLDSAFALCQRLGINSAKTGYVNRLIDGKELHDSQYGVRHYRKVLDTAAKYHVMIDNHEPVMPTGLQRTLPNLMTQEGVRGCEYDAWSTDGGNPASHTVTLPFTRGLAGPMDYTPGIFNYENKAVPGTRPHTTIAKQLAMAVVLYSPLQMASDMIENYENRPEFEFLTICPTTWDKTVVPEASIGQYVTVARKERGGDRWFLGAMTGDNKRCTKLSLDFLEPGVKYVAKVFADGDNADWETNPYPVQISEIEVDSTSRLPLNMARSGGAAVVLTPKK